MKALKKHFLLFLILVVSFSEGLDWNVPFLENVSFKDKTTQIDKSQELNSFLFRSNRKITPSIEIKKIDTVKPKFYSKNIISNYFAINSKPNKIIKLTGLLSYLHLLKLY